jgi:hypothetical protein
VPPWWAPPEFEGACFAELDAVPSMRLIGALLNWLMGLQPGRRSGRQTPVDRLLELRGVCYTILDDLQTPLGKDLLARVDLAKTANDFWHMRPRLFDAVSEVHGEGVAAQRLLQLDSLLRVSHDRRSQFARGSVPAGAATASTPRRRATDAPKSRTGR